MPAPILLRNRITVHAPLSVVFNLAAAIEDWPRLLPHYKYVKTLGSHQGSPIVAMSAKRSGIPVVWVSIQDVVRPASSIRYRHVRGVTRGMTVEWTFNASAQGTAVTIVHRFNPPWPAYIGPFIARYIVCNFFVHHIADTTLLRIKQIAESTVMPIGDNVHER